MQCTKITIVSSPRDDAIKARSKKDAIKTIVKYLENHLFEHEAHSLVLAEKHCKNGKVRDNDHGGDSCGCL